MFRIPNWQKNPTAHRVPDWNSVGSRFVGWLMIWIFYEHRSSEKDKKTTTSALTFNVGGTTVIVREAWSKQRPEVTFKDKLRKQCSVSCGSCKHVFSWWAQQNLRLEYTVKSNYLAVIPNVSWSLNHHVIFCPAVSRICTVHKLITIKNVPKQTVDLCY